MGFPHLVYQFMSLRRKKIGPLKLKAIYSCLARVNA